VVATSPAPHPFAPPGGHQLSGTQQAPIPGNPFAPPAGAQAPTPGSGNPFAPPAADAAFPPPAGGAPFAAPAPNAPYAQQPIHGSPGAPVPPPPISPDGPWQVPYGYPLHPGHHAPGYGWPGLKPPPSNGLGIAALVLGICAAVLFCLWPVAIVGGVLAVIFGFIGRAKARRGEATNPGHALAGLICGAIGVLLGVGFIVLLIMASDSSPDGSDTDPFDDGYSTSLSLVLSPEDATSPAADPTGTSPR
jgi:hypothetical protein